MDIHQRLQEIQSWEILLGRYTGLLSKLYSDKTIDSEYFAKELSFIKDILVRLKGVDHEDVAVITQQIKELYEG